MERSICRPMERSTFMVESRGLVELRSAYDIGRDIGRAGRRASGPQAIQTKNRNKRVARRRTPEWAVSLTITAGLQTLAPEVTRR